MSMLEQLHLLCIVSFFWLAFGWRAAAPASGVADLTRQRFLRLQADSKADDNVAAV